MKTEEKWVCLKFVSKLPNPATSHDSEQQIKLGAFHEARSMRRMSCWCEDEQCAHVVKLISFHQDVIFPHYEGPSHDASFYVFVMVRPRAPQPPIGSTPPSLAFAVADAAHAFVRVDMHSLTSSDTQLKSNIIVFLLPLCLCSLESITTGTLRRLIVYHAKTCPAVCLVARLP